jgi:hypothetical protein
MKASNFFATPNLILYGNISFEQPVDDLLSVHFTLYSAKVALRDISVNEKNQRQA